MEDKDAIQSTLSLLLTTRQLKLPSELRGLLFERLRKAFCISGVSGIMNYGIRKETNKEHLVLEHSE